jgi:AraC-like DNA-binding protein
MFGQDGDVKTLPSLRASDPLGEALHRLRLTGVFYSHAELTAPWGLAMPAADGHVWFHIVTQGECELDGPHADPVTVRAGDMALVPHGHGHRLRTGPDVATPLVTTLPDDRVGERYSLLHHGGGGAPTTLVCGVVAVEHPVAHRLFDALPPVVHLPAARSIDAGWMDRTLTVMAAEARRLRPGGEAVVTRLADVLVIQALRVWLDQDEQARTGWLGALADPEVGEALRLMHRDPGRDWSVATLADAVALSRSAFAARFTALVDTSPHRYLTEVRMRVAGDLLRREGVTVAEAARRVGYRSQAAFHRAYTRTTGAPPGEARGSAETDPGPPGEARG